MKPIQVSPTPETSKKVDTFVNKRFAASRAKFAETAIEFFIPLLERGDVAIINGKVRFLKTIAPQPVEPEPLHPQAA